MDIIVCIQVISLCPDGVCMDVCIQVFRLCPDGVCIDVCIQVFRLCTDSVCIDVCIQAFGSWSGCVLTVCVSMSVSRPSVPGQAVY